MLAALEERRKTGLGQHIDLSMLDGLISVMESIAMKALYTDDELRPTGSHQAVSAPYGVFETSDGHIAIATANDGLFVRLASVLERLDWLKDPRFASDSERGLHRRELQSEIENVLAKFSCADSIRMLESVGIPCSPVLGAREALAQPHVIARKLLREEPDGFVTVENGFQIRGSRTQFVSAPSLGQHDELVEMWLQEELRT